MGGGTGHSAVLVADMQGRVKVGEHANGPQGRGSYQERADKTVVTCRKSTIDKNSGTMWRRHFYMAAADEV